MEAETKRQWLAGLLLTGILVVAIGFRFYNIKNYPPGLFPDQAANGEDVISILHGNLKPFYPANNGREASFFYIEAAFVKAYGIGVWPLFASSALVGTLTVLLTYFATRIYFGRLSGLLAALFIATNSWQVTISRTGFRAIMIPLFVAAFTAAVGYMIRAVRQKQLKTSYIYAALAGATFAGGFYTYIAYRIMIGVVLGMLAFFLLAALHPKIGFPHLKRYRWQSVIAVLIGLVVIAPLAWYFVQHPQEFVGRASQVSVFNPDLERQFGGGKLLPTIAYSTQETLMSYFAGHGDLNWRQNVAGFPLLNPLVGLLFLLGLAWAIHGLVLVVIKMFRGEELHESLVFPYLLLLLTGMLIPVITTAEGIPHGLRSIGLAIPIFILAGTAGSVCLYWLQKQRKLGLGRPIVFGAIAGLLLIGSLYDGYLYFFVSGNSPDAYVSYRGDLTVVADYLKSYQHQYPKAPVPYLVLDGYSLITIHYLTSTLTYPQHEPTSWRQVEPNVSQGIFLEPNEVIVFTQSTLNEANQYAAQHPNIQVVESKYNKWGQEVMRVYQAKPTAPQGSEGGLDA